MLDGIIDLSHHNTISDFGKAKSTSGLVGVIHKATQGTAFVDPTYSIRRPLALGAGLLWGAYHFGVGDADAVEQAQHFLSVVNPGPNDLLALDFEANPQGETMTIAQAELFVTYVQKQTGKWPGFYANIYDLKRLLGAAKNATLVNCWLWLADWAPTPSVPATWPSWTIWQYADHATGQQAVAGIGNCDLDRFNGDLAGLQRLWGYAN